MLYATLWPRISPIFHFTREYERSTLHAQPVYTKISKLGQSFLSWFGTWFILVYTFKKFIILLNSSLIRGVICENVRNLLNPRNIPRTSHIFVYIKTVLQFLGGTSTNFELFTLRPSLFIWSLQFKNAIFCVLSLLLFNVLYTKNALEQFVAFDTPCIISWNLCAVSYIVLFNLSAQVVFLPQIVMYFFINS